MPTFVSPEEIKLAYERDKAAGLKTVTGPHEVPSSYDAVTTQWLDAVIRRGAPGPKITSFYFRERDDGYANRCRIILDYDGEIEGTCWPRSVFCKSTEGLDGRIFLGSLLSAECEANFFKHVRGLLNIEAPEAYFAGFDTHNYAYFVILKDIGGKAIFCDETTPIDYDQAADQLTTLAQLHGRFSNHAERNALPFVDWKRWWQNFSQRAPAMQDRWVSGISACGDTLPPRLAERADEIVPAIHKSVDAQCALPQTLAHNDPHLRNWYITQDGKMGLGDWQTITTAHWARDVAYCIATSLETVDRRDWESRLIEHYLDVLADAGGLRCSVDEAQHYLAQQILSAFSFWVHLVAPKEGDIKPQPDVAIMQFIGRLATAADDWRALDSL